MKTLAEKIADVNEGEVITRLNVITEHIVEMERENLPTVFDVPTKPDTTGAD